MGHVPGFPQGNVGHVLAPGVGGGYENGSEL